MLTVYSDIYKVVRGLIVYFLLGVWRYLSRDKQDSSHAPFLLYDLSGNFRVANVGVYEVWKVGFVDFLDGDGAGGVGGAGGGFGVVGLRTVLPPVPGQGTGGGRVRDVPVVFPLRFDGVPGLLFPEGDDADGG